MPRLSLLKPKREARSEDARACARGAQRCSGSARAASERKALRGSERCLGAPGEATTGWRSDPSGSSELLFKAFYRSLKNSW